MHILPEVMSLFAKKNAEYGENAFELGVRGQFSDIWRKIGKLRTALWDQDYSKLTSESVEEVIRDLIGHLLLTLDLLNGPIQRGYSGRVPPTVNAANFPDEHGFAMPMPSDDEDLIGAIDLAPWTPTAPDQVLIWEPPPGYRGAHSYTVAELVVRVQGHRLTMASTDDTRCAWHYGDVRNDVTRCVGKLDHQHQEKYPESAHINKIEQVWE
jgi:hypothetical protein